MSDASGANAPGGEDQRHGDLRRIERAPRAVSSAVAVTTAIAASAVIASVAACSMPDRRPCEMLVRRERLSTGLDPVEHQVLGARGQDLAGPLHHVDDVRAQVPDSSRSRSPSSWARRSSHDGTLAAATTNGRSTTARTGIHDHRPDHDGHRDDERHHERRCEMGGEQLQELDVGHRRASHVPRPGDRKYAGDTRGTSRTAPAKLVDQPEGHHVDHDDLEPPEQRRSG